MATPYFNISISAHVKDPAELAKIDRVAKRCGMKRSAFIFQAALEKAAAFEASGRKKGSTKKAA